MSDHAAPPVGLTRLRSGGSSGNLTVDIQSGARTSQSLSRGQSLVDQHWRPRSPTDSRSGAQRLSLDGTRGVALDTGMPSQRKSLDVNLGAAGAAGSFSGDAASISTSRVGKSSRPASRSAPLQPADARAPQCAERLLKEREMRRNRSQGALSSGDGECLPEEGESDTGGGGHSRSEGRVPSLTRLLDGSGGDPESRKSLPEIRQRLIVVANRLPVSARKKPGGGWVLEVRNALLKALLRAHPRWSFCVQSLRPIPESAHMNFVSDTRECRSEPAGPAPCCAWNTSTTFSPAQPARA